MAEDKDSFEDMMHTFQEDVSSVKQTLGDLKAIHDQLNKARSVVCMIHNATDQPLSFRNSSLEHGALATIPPATIAPRTAAAFGAQSSSGSIATGTEGSVWYDAPDGTTFRFDWNNPFLGSNSSDAKVEGPFVRLYKERHEHGGGDENAPMQFTAFQKMPNSVYKIWVRLGGATGTLGMPTSDVLPTADAIGLFMLFELGAVYGSPNSGVHEVHGDIWRKWISLGTEASVLGYPTSDEFGTPDGIGRASHFQNGSIYWTAETGAHEVHGRIRDKWAELGWEGGSLGYPISDEMDTPDGNGRMNRFIKNRLKRSTIVMDKATGLIEVHDDLTDRQTTADTSLHRMPRSPFAPTTTVGAASTRRSGL